MIQGSPLREFGVVMTLVERPAQLEWCLHHLRLVYPQIEVVVISDGVGYPKYGDICDAHRVRFVRSDRLKRAELGGLWWLRTLTEALQMDTEYIVKIDPDTKFQREIKAWPTRDIFGTLAGRDTPWEHIQGGVQGFTRAAAERLLESGFFQDQSLANPATYAWSRGLLSHARRTGYLCTDAMLRAAKRKLKLAWGNWPEVCSQWHRLPSDAAKYAVTHPHKWKTLTKS